VSAVRREPWKWYALLLIPFAATLWVPLYDRAEPSVAGIPFFYWYLLAWILVVAALNGAVYFATREKHGE
jgi:predicted exporter